jgi:hypothetical protein
VQRPRCAADLTTLGTQVCGLAVRALLPLLGLVHAWVGQILLNCNVFKR